MKCCNTEGRRRLPCRTLLYLMLLCLPLWCLLLGGCGHHGKADPAAASADTSDSSAGDKAPPAVVAVSTTTLAPETVSSSVEATGVLGPLPGAESRVAPAAPGKVRAVLVQNGDRVVRGQLIATLEPGPLNGQVVQAEAAVRSAEAAVQQARAGYSSTVSSNTAAVQAARTNVQSAQVALDKLLAGSRPEEIAHLQADVTADNAAVLSSQQNLERQQRLFDAGLVAQKDFQAAELQLTTARATLRAAQQDLRLKQIPNRPQDITAARLAVQQARDALATAIANQGQNQVKAGDIAVANQQLNSAKGALAAARAQLAAQHIRAPVSGTVVQRLANPGEYVDTTGAIAVIANLSAVRVLLQVPSSQIAAIRVGDPVQFTTESQPDQIHEARVDLVSSAVTANSNTIQVEATAPNPNGQLRDDGFVRARIFTSVHPHVLSAPASSIVLLDNKPTVFVVGRDNVAHAHPVKQGIRQGDSVEILSGLSPGDRIVTTGAYELDDGTHVRAASTGA